MTFKIGFSRVKIWLVYYNFLSLTSVLGVLVKVPDFSKRRKKKKFFSFI